MEEYEFRLITIDDIPAMTDLLIERQNIESRIYPFLKNSCLNTKYIADMFKNLFSNSKVIGIGAFSKEELIGYILGEIKIDSSERYVWVPYEGIAIRTYQSSELIRNLYAKASVIWIEQGCFNHYIFVPLGSKEYYDAVLRLSFSIQQVYAVMNMDEYIPFKKTADVDIRVAGRSDSEAMGRMSKIIRYYQGTAPTFAPVLPEDVEEIKAGFMDIVEDKDAIVLIAEKDKRETGFQIYETVTPDLMSSNDGVELIVAGTYLSKMGTGIGKQLMNEGYKLMKEKRYMSIMADWRIANLASSTFWPKCGFKPIAYRMFRSIDRDIAWANSTNPGIRKI